LAAEATLTLAIPAREEFKRIKLVIPLKKSLAEKRKAMEAALKAYEAKRLPATRDVVLANRSAPPDAILHEVYKRTGDKPFRHIDDVISREELVALSEGYKRVAGYQKEQLAKT
jgi:hypothetical protein